MAWLTGWTRRRVKVVNNLTIPDYQMKLIVHQSGLGPDTSTDIYLGGYIRSDFADLRFTGPDQTTLLSHWIESISGTSPNQIATIWIKIPTLIPVNNIYIYYDNPSSTTISDLANTFLAADLTTFTKVDPNSRITINSANKATFLNLHRNENNYLYKSISPTQDYRYDFEYMITGGYSTAFNDGYFFIGGMNEIANNPMMSNNYLSIRNYAAFHISTYRSYMQRNVNGSVDIVPPGDNYAPISLNTLYYATVTRIGTTVTMNVYTNSSRTTHTGGSPRSGTVSPAVAMNYAIPLASWYDGNTIGYVSGYIQNPILRKYTSPEPTFGVSGNEELNITAIDFTLSSNICADPCSITAGAWQNLGGSSITFRPAILIDETTIAYAISDITIPSGSTGYSLITTPTLLVGSHTICPYPN